MRTEIGEVAAAFNARSSAVGHLIDKHASGARHVHRLQDGERRRVLNQTTRVAWCMLDVGDDRVEGVPGVQLAVEAAGQLLVRPALIGKGLALLDHQLHHVGVGGRAEEDDATCETERPKSHMRSGSITFSTTFPPSTLT